MQYMFQYPETNGTDTDMLDGGNIDQVARTAEETFYRAPADEVGRHQEAFARLADAGVTWMMISGATKTAAETFQFLETVGHNYIHQRSL